MITEPARLEAEMGFPARSFGHLALNYRPGDEQPARRLLQILGCTLVDNGLSPGQDGFCTVLLDGPTGNYADNLFFLSPANPQQMAIEDLIDGALAAAPQLAAQYATRVGAAPESISHIGLRYRSFEELESVLASLDAAGAPSGELAGRINVVKYRARPDLDPAVDAVMAESTQFSGEESPAFANAWVQCFVRTDVVAYGLLALGQTFELDYVFEPFFAEPPTFGRPKS